MKKIVRGDLSFDDMVSCGLVMEQGAWKVEQIEGCMSGKDEDRVTAQEEQVRALKREGPVEKYLVEHVHIQHMNNGNVQVRKLFVFYVDKQGISKVHWYVQLSLKRKQPKIYQVELRGQVQLLRTQAVK